MLNKGTNNVSMDNEARRSRIERLNQLKNRRRESERLNRREVVRANEARKTGIKRTSSSVQDNDAEVDVTNDEDDECKKLLNYTIDDCDKWSKKRAAIKQNKQNDGYQSYSQLAEYSYNKEITRVVVDKDEYERQKETQSKLQIKGIVNPSKITDINKPSKETISAVVNSLTEANHRKMSKRETRRISDANDYINDRNRQFNLKLDRQFD
ncbi:uncharacterized protein PRCAT00000086001 [Priceomyces carsonii]|uniref:uncharacterized protein n=1 Tax=Priceomyces carsonii TaxID=28549 RepID=UPI002ED859BC|nr:unnamed protein product [Priceomyces carsonii]